MTTAGLKPIGIRTLIGGAKGWPPLDFDLGSITFTAGMSKRTGQGPFAAAPIVQGDWDFSGTGDVVSFSRGSQVSGSWYDNMDGNQWFFFTFWTPEHSYDDITGKIYLLYASSAHYVAYDFDNDRFEVCIGTQTSTADKEIAAGTTYALVAGGSSVNTIDGTDYARISVDDTHTFGATTQPTASAPDATIYLGSNNGANACGGILEGSVLVRDMPFDGTYGTDLSIGDVINLHYAAGAGADLATFIGSWDTTWSNPTNSTTGALVTGTGEAWSHPHSSNVVEHGWAEDGGYLGGPYALIYNGSSTWVDCGSNATLDDLGAAGATVQVEGWFRSDGSSSTEQIYHKGNGLSTGHMVYIGGTHRLTAYVPLATVNAQAEASATSVRDGRWHHYVMSYNDTTKSLQMALDGKWGAADVGVGAYQADAASNWEFGRLTNLSSYFEGAIGWHRVWNAAQYTPGTDFIPDRVFNSAGTVESWAADDGTGATLTASITSPACDGTITNGSWEPQWDMEGSPLVMPMVDYDGSTTSCVVADAAAIQDLHDAAFTVEAWVRADGTGENNAGYIFEKGIVSSKGWYFSVSATNGLDARVYAATTNAWSTSGTDEWSDDGKLHHVAMQFDDAGDRKLYIWMDGIPVSSYTHQDAAVDAVVSDVGEDLYHGNRSDGARTWNGAFIGWSRISDTLRYTNGVPFVPNAPDNPPGADGNTAWQTDYSDGAGSTLTDDSGNGNNGTLSNHIWYNTPDMTVVAPGNRIYNWGYVVGVDAVDEGIVQAYTGASAGSNYVCRLVYSHDPSGHGQPAVTIYDDTNGAVITDFEGPKMVSAHTGANNSASCIDNTNKIVFPNIVGWTIYNITDGSSGTITAYVWDGTDTTITVALAGGTDNDFDTGDVYRIVPPRSFTEFPWVETFTWELPTIARNGVVADCVDFSVKVTNVDDEGLIFYQQYEQLTQLVDNPSLETGAGNPWIPDGWTNTGVDAGESVQELAIIHSGSAALESAAGWTSDESIQQILTSTADKFYSFGAYRYGTGAACLGFTGDDTADDLVLQATLADPPLLADQDAAQWLPNYMVTRAINTTPDTSILGAAIQGYVDDIYAFELDDVSLTVTPASYANSLENTDELRVDGRDTCTQPSGAFLTASRGWVRCNIRPRHDPADILAFGNIPYWIEIWGDANNYIGVYGSAANTMILGANIAGGGLVWNLWNCAGAWSADDELQVEIDYYPSFIWLKVDGAVVATITTPVAFSTVPTEVDWLHINGGGYAGDATVSAP